MPCDGLHGRRHEHGKRSEDEVSRNSFDFLLQDPLLKIILFKWNKIIF